MAQPVYYYGKSFTGHLGSVGVSTPVSTVHTWVTVQDNQALRDADFVGANAHASYDETVFPVRRETDFVCKTVVPALKAAFQEKKVYITESGWQPRSAVLSSLLPTNEICSWTLTALVVMTSVSTFAFEYDD